MFSVPRSYLIALFALGVGASSASAQSVRPPIEAYASLPALDEVAISPDGTGKIDLAKKALFQKQVYFAEVDDTAAGANITIDWTAGLKHKFTASENVTFAFTAPSGPTHLVLKLTQPFSAKTFTWPATVKWVYTPSFAIGNKTYIATFYWDGTNYYGSVAGPY